MEWWGLCGLGFWVGDFTGIEMVERWIERFYLFNKVEFRVFIGSQEILRFRVSSYFSMILRALLCISM